MQWHWKKSGLLAALILFNFLFVMTACSSSRISYRELNRQLALARAEKQAEIDRMKKEMASLRSIAAERDGLRVKLESVERRAEECRAERSRLENRLREMERERAKWERTRKAAREAAARARAIEEEKKRIEKRLENLIGRRQLGVDVTELGVRITVRDAILFRSGSAELRGSAWDVLREVAGALAQSQAKEIRIVGHTDSIPIRTPQFPSNWELSVARALAVLHSLSRNFGIPQEKMVSIGYGPYRPIADNGTEEGRRKNRRVEIYLIPEGEASSPGAGG
ncbi:MAG: hypothetical protein D6679_00570 [Candidatus Hydrogenedentota bacterium]|nr:MAG: hypothetical protein D6679_00570 [Candidatus Hydrogenedentota bacterium]